MKSLILYWFVGCAVIGFPLGTFITECPNSKIKVGAIIEMVATWPVVIAMALARTGKPPLPKSVCEAIE